jgi:ATP/maltotriose-dependent transcriptional regulator MalT
MMASSRYTARTAFMNTPITLNNLLELFAAKYPDRHFGFLRAEIYSQPLTPQNQQDYIQLLNFARELQTQEPIFEGIYRVLVCLYVLNGSRLDELAKIDRRLRGLALGQSSLLLISGVSGIGKTSLALACHERVLGLGAAFIVGRCYEQEQSPYWLWRDVIHSITQATQMPVGQLPAPLGAGNAARSSQHLIQALAGWVRARTSAQPLVILLDDLQWADPDSLEAFSRLARFVEDDPIVFMATYRSEAVQKGHPLYNYLPTLQRNQRVDHLQLEPLTDEDTVRLVDGYHGACSPELATYLQQRAEGHPLFMVELLHDLIEQGLLSQATDGQWLPPEQSAPVPTLLKQLIVQRVARLGKDAEELLSLAAVVGDTWRFRIVEHLVGLPEDRLLDALEEALRSDVIRTLNDQTETYQFSHGLIRRVLYEAQLAQRRKLAHARIAGYLESTGADFSGLAYHFLEAENWAKAYRYCLAAGDEARHRFAIHSALSLYHQALNAAHNGVAAVEPPASIEAYERIGDTHLILDQRSEAEIAYGRMRDIAKSTEDRTAEARALAHLASVRVALYQLDLAEKTALKALALAASSHEPRLLATAHGSLGRAYLVRGELDKAEQNFEYAAQSLQLIEEPAMLSHNARYRAYGAIWQGRYAEAEQFAQQAVEQAQKTQDYLPITGGHQVLSYVQIETGQYAAAHQTIVSVLQRLDPALGTHHHYARLLNQMGYLHFEIGGAAEAFEWDQRALAACRSASGDSNYETERYSVLNLATDMLALGQVERARDYVAEFEAIKDLYEYGYFRYFNRYQLLLAEIHLAQGNYEQALHQAQEARNLADARSIHKNIAKSRFYEGQALLGLGQHQEAIQHMQLAIKTVDQIEHGSLRWKMRYRLAQMYARLGIANGDLLEEARALVATINRHLSGSELQRLFLQSPLVQALYQEKAFVPPLVVKKQGFPNGLTLREVEVLRLVARGATNQQVAEALQISVRTVNTHMTHILNKINCANRTEATAFAIRHNLVK